MRLFYQDKSGNYPVEIYEFSEQDNKDYEEVEDKNIFIKKLMADLYLDIEELDYFVQKTKYIQFFVCGFTPYTGNFNSLCNKKYD